MSKEKKCNSNNVPGTKSKLNIIRICVAVTTVVIIFLSYLLILFLININEKVTNIDNNLELMTHGLKNASEGLKKTEKKIQDSWII